MDEHHDLVRRLCTRAGELMEDASVDALNWSEDLAIEERLERLCATASKIQVLLRTARALV